MKKLGLILIPLFATTAFAGSITYGPFSIAVTDTDWSDNFSITQWDPALFPGQVLTSVSFDLTGSVEGVAKVENLSETSGSTINVELKAEIDLTHPVGGGLIVQVIPLASDTFVATVYDTVLDWGGDSGNTWSDLTNTGNDLGSTTSNLATFTGSGSVLVPVSATATSIASGGGNITSNFSTDAGAQLSVTYNYIPEPVSMSLLALGGLGVLLRRKR